MTRQAECLVVGYGDDLYSDDGAGRRAAEMVESLALPGTRVISIRQLTPELAEDVAMAGMVIFVDALPACGEVRCRMARLTEARRSQTSAHSLTPEGLLLMAHSLYGCSPPAWLIGVPTETLDLGEGLSALARTGIRDAAYRVRDMLWIRQVCSHA